MWKNGRHRQRVIDNKSNEARSILCYRSEQRMRYIPEIAETRVKISPRSGAISSVPRIHPSTPCRHRRRRRRRRHRRHRRRRGFVIVIRA